MVGLKVLPGIVIVDVGVKNGWDEVVRAKNMVDATGTFLAKAGDICAGVVEVWT